MESGMAFDDAVREAQRLGVAETDPSNDIDGIDAAVKVVGLANVLMEGNLSARRCQREPASAASPPRACTKRAKAARLGSWLAARGERATARSSPSVAPERLKPDDPLYSVRGTSLAVGFETDVFRELIIGERDPGPEATAYGMLADFINAVRSSLNCLPVRSPQLSPSSMLSGLAQQFPALAADGERPAGSFLRRAGRNAGAAAGDRRHRRITLPPRTPTRTAPSSPASAPTRFIADAHAAMADFFNCDPR